MGDAATDRRRRFEAEAVVFMQPLYRSALHLTRSPADASDLVQETYLRAYRAFDQFTPGTNCKAWLFTIMHSIFNTVYRKARREQDGMRTLALEAQMDGQYERWLAQPDESAGQDPVGSKFGPEFNWADAEIEQALRQLPEEFRSAVLLVDIGELSYEEAAAALQCPVGTVRSRLFRARKLLFAALHVHAREMGYPIAPEQA
ncbi:MAG: sigma-70 family RNA polymerase sigma factor [Nevskiales bacterium]